MTRIVAGAARGRRLAVPPHGTRPTSDRVREALFSSLDAHLVAAGGWERVRFLDLYAGSGAVGLEALSRGAPEVLLVESDRTAAAVVRRNVDVVDLDGATVHVADVRQAVAATASTAYDVVFLDPPYDVGAQVVSDVLATAARRGWLAPGAVVVLERATRDPDFNWPDGFSADRSRRYGETTLWFGRFGTVAAC